MATTTAHYGRTSIQPKKQRRGYILPLLTVLTLGSAMATWQFMGNPFALGHLQLHSDRKNSGGGVKIRPEEDLRINRRFQIYGVRFGMTPDMVGDLHPNAKPYVGPNTGTVDMINFDTKRGAFVSWMIDEVQEIKTEDGPQQINTQRVWRMRLDEAHVTMTEDEVLAHYRLAYGKPLAANCQLSQLGDGPQCHFRWWGGDGIHLEAMSQTKTLNDGTVYTLLTTIATDSFAQAKIRDENRITPEFIEARARPAAPFGRYALPRIDSSDRN